MSVKAALAARNRETYEVWRADDAGHFYLVFTPCPATGDEDAYTQRESYSTFARAEARRIALDGSESHRGTHHVVKVTTVHEIAPQGDGSE